MTTRVTFREPFRVTVPCEECGGVIGTGDWPFCGGDPLKHEDARGFGEEPLQPYFDEDITERGEFITSRGQRRAIMRKEGLEYNPHRRTGRLGFCDLGAPNARCE